MKLSEVIAFLGLGIDIKDDFELVGIASADMAEGDEITYLESSKFLDCIKSSRAGAILIREEHISALPKGVVPLICENPHLEFAKLSSLYAKKDFTKAGKSTLDSGVKIVGNVFFGENVKIGKNTTICNGVTISDNVIIGEDCKIYPNVVI